MMRRGSLPWIGTLFLMCLVSCQGSTTSPKADPATTIDHYVAGLTKNQGFSGAVLIAQSGNVLLHKGYGWADEKQRVPNKSSTRFRIGSVTKQFTAMAILLLQERGKLLVPDPICHYISDCPAIWSKITIHHLLTHTSGIPEYLTAEFPTQQTTTPDRLIAGFKAKPLDFAPGAQFSYSNSGYVILGSIIEKVSGESYAQFLEQSIFRVIHLTNTGYDPDNPSLPQYATGYSDPWTKAAYFDPSVGLGAGGLYSTVDDLYRWDTELFNRTFGSNDSLTQMFKAQVTACDSVGTLCSEPDCAAQRINCFSYGYGWLLDQHPYREAYVRAIWHGGLEPGFASFNYYYPDEKLTLVVLSNLDTFSSKWYTFVNAVDSAFSQI